MLIQLVVWDCLSASSFFVQRWQRWREASHQNSDEPECCQFLCFGWTGPCSEFVCVVSLFADSAYPGACAYKFIVSYCFLSGITVCESCLAIVAIGFAFPHMVLAGRRLSDAAAWASELGPGQENPSWNKHFELKSKCEGSSPVWSASRWQLWSGSRWSSSNRTPALRDIVPCGCCSTGHLVPNGTPTASL